MPTPCACRHRARAWANIPPKANRKDPICFSPYLYKARNLVERFFNRVKQFRRIATRYDKLAENYLAALKLVQSASGYAVMSLRPSSTTAECVITAPRQACPADYPA